MIVHVLSVPRVIRSMCQHSSQHLRNHRFRQAHRNRRTMHCRRWWMFAHPARALPMPHVSVIPYVSIIPHVSNISHVSSTLNVSSNQQYSTCQQFSHISLINTSTQVNVPAIFPETRIKTFGWLSLQDLEVAKNLVDCYTEAPDRTTTCYGVRYDIGICDGAWAALDVENTLLAPSIANIALTSRLSK